MSSEELAAIPVEDLFEEVDALPADVDTTWSRRQKAGRPRSSAFLFPSPPNPRRWPPRTPESAAPLLRASSPDGLADLFLYRRGDGEYWLEVSLAPRAAAGTAVVAVRYPTVGGGEQELLIPGDR